MITTARNPAIERNRMPIPPEARCRFYYIDSVAHCKEIEGFRFNLDNLLLVIKLNLKHYSFQAKIQKVPGIDGAYIIFPCDVLAEFGKKRVKVHATFDGEPYDGSLVRMGTKEHIIGIRKDIRQKIGKQPGDTVFVALWERE